MIYEILQSSATAVIVGYLCYERYFAPKPEPTVVHEEPVQQNRLHEKIMILRHGQPHAWCREGTRDFQEAYQTPGLSLRYPDGSVIDGKQKREGE